MLLIGFIGIGTLLLLSPIVAGFTSYDMSTGLTLAALASGAILTLSSSTALVISRFYRKTKANEAFVRTGAGGMKVIRDGGAMVIPFIHELVAVSLETLKLEVVRSDGDALITEDKLRADIKAEFFVRVQPDSESILQASRSLGERMHDSTAVKALVEDKLVSALRTAAAMKSLEELNSERDEFLSEVIKLVGDDLRSNGLILESVTISRLDQTAESYLKDENIFDAQGRRKIAEITQQNLTERNRLVRAGEQARKLQDVETAKRVLELERTEKEAAALQQAEVAKVRAKSDEEARRAAIAAEQEVNLVAIEKEQALGVAARKQEEAIEVAARLKQERVAEAEKQRVAVEKQLAVAEAEREIARQRIETVRITEEAQRLKEKQVIDAQAQAEMKFVSEQRRADADAYTMQKNAQARKQAADAESIAIRMRAEAEAEAVRQAASGEKAKAMVPVEVEQARLEVDRDRIETVVKPELTARKEHGKVAQDFELAKLAIQAEKQVRIALADASSKLFQKLEAKLYGTPQDARKIMDSMMRGQNVANTVSGFMEATDDKTNSVLAQIASTIQTMTSGQNDNAKDGDRTALASNNGAEEAALPAE